MNLKLRIVAIIVVILLTNFLVAGFLMVKDARRVLVAEMEISTQLAIDALMSALPSLSIYDDLDKRLLLAIDSMHSTRYTHAWFENMNGELRLGRQKWDRLPLATDKLKIPDWFVKLVEPEMLVFKRLVTDDTGLSYGYFFVSIDPSTEVVEAWQNIKTLFQLGVIFLVLIVSLVYIALHRGLRPLNTVADALGKLEKGDFSARVGAGVVKELIPIHDRFNHMAGVLEKTVDENHALTKNMLTVQEDERRDMARELHDELGPCLFGIRVDLVDIDRIAGAHQLTDISKKVKSLKSITNDIQSLIRKMLSRLRPIILDDLGLHDALEDMLRNWREKQPKIDWEWNLVGDYSSLPDALKVTAYRIVQECITNSARHANASHVKVEVQLEPKEGLSIIVTDNGKGITNDTVYGFGLIGMRERVHAFGGQITFGSLGDQGLQVQVFIPLKGSHQ